MFFWLLVFFILGTAVGSFLNVVVDRTAQGKSILGRSVCDACGRTLGVLDLVPVVSFSLLRARCRYCGFSLSWQYPLVEAATGLLFAGAFWVLAREGRLDPVSLVYVLFVLSVLTVVAVFDFKFSLIPTGFVFAASLAALFYNYFSWSTLEFVRGTAGAGVIAAPFLLLVIFSRGRAMGSGDVPLSFLIGLFLGFGKGLLAIFLGFVLGGAVAVLLLVLGRRKIGSTVPFGPFLVVGAIISLFWGAGIIHWYFGM